MSIYQRLFTEAVKSGKLVSVSHETIRSGSRNRSSCQVVKATDKYAIVKDGEKFRTIRYESIYALNVRPS